MRGWGGAGDGDFGTRDDRLSTPFARLLPRFRTLNLVSFFFFFAGPPPDDCLLAVLSRNAESGQRKQHRSLVQWFLGGMIYPLKGGRAGPGVGRTEDWLRRRDGHDEAPHREDGESGMGKIKFAAQSWAGAGGRNRGSASLLQRLNWNLQAGQQSINYADSCQPLWEALVAGAKQQMEMMGEIVICRQNRYRWRNRERQEGQGREESAGLGYKLSKSSFMVQSSSPLTLPSGLPEALQLPLPLPPTGSHLSPFTHMSPTLSHGTTAQCQ